MENGQHREPALCQLYRHTLSPMGEDVGTYSPKPAGIPVGMGKSFNLDPRSWWVWVRHLVVTGLNATECLQNALNVSE